MFTLTIETGNDGMRRRADVARALRAVAVRLAESDAEVEYAGVPIMDANGNTVGSWSYEPEEPEEQEEDDAP